MKRIVILAALIGLASGALFSQSLNMKIGVFVPQLESDLWQTNIENLTFDKSDMVNVYYGAEFEGFLNRNSSFTVEIGSYTKTQYAMYRDYEYDNGAPIYQNVSLRIVPIEAGLKFYPMGHRSTLNPFIGGGVGLYSWTYQQWGDFIDFGDFSIYEGNAETKRFSVGFFGRVGFVYRFIAQAAISLEGKYQYLKGHLSGNFEGFEPLDMSGFQVNAGINIFFR